MEQVTNRVDLLGYKRQPFWKFQVVSAKLDPVNINQKYNGFFIKLHIFS